MNRLARAILVGVALFVLVVAGTLIAKSRSAKVESLGPTPARADLRMKEIQLAEDSGSVRWRLNAEQALIFEAEGRTALRKVVVNVDERDRSWNVVGDEGDLFEQARKFEVRKNVVLRASDGLQLDTTALRWEGNRKRLWTDLPVKITRSGVVIHGSALEVNMDEQAMTVAGRVHAIFASGRRP